MGNISKTIKINGELVKALRTKRGLSQKELAGKMKVDVGTVSRWERGEIDHVRRDIFGKLCMFLNATEAEICSNEPLPESSASQHAASRGQMNLSINTACRNALSLVALRYGVTRQQIVEAAPLLFVVVAELCLRERRKRLAKFRDAEDRMEEALEALPNHLYLYSPAREWEDQVKIEEYSIDTRDLFGTKVCNLGEGNDAEDNPFAAFLSPLLARLDPPAKAVSWRHDSAPQYQICAKEAADLVGGDTESIDAILSGATALHQMPSEVRRSSPTERAQWVLSARRQTGALADLEDFSIADTWSEGATEESFDIGI